MPAYKRSDPAKLARDRAAIQKSQEQMNHPSHPAFEEIGKVFGDIDRAIKKRVAKKRQEYELQHDYGAPYGPPPKLGGALVTGFKKNRRVDA